MKRKSSLTSPEETKKEANQANALYEPINSISFLAKPKSYKEWSKEEDSALLKLSTKYNYNWKKISLMLPGRSHIQCSSRFDRIKPGVNKGTWTKEEDEKLIELVEQLGQVWTEISSKLKSRSSKQVRDRYLNYLKPGLNKSKFSIEEDNLLIEKYRLYGGKWSKISSFFPDRTSDIIKNRFYSSLRKKYMNIDYLRQKKHRELLSKADKVVELTKNTKKQLKTDVLKMIQSDLNNKDKIQPFHNLNYMFNNIKINYASVFPNKLDNNDPISNLSSTNEANAQVDVDLKLKEAAKESSIDELEINKNLLFVLLQSTKSLDCDKFPLDLYDDEVFDCSFKNYSDDKVFKDLSNEYDSIIENSGIVNNFNLQNSLDHEVLSYAEAQKANFDKLIEITYKKLQMLDQYNTTIGNN